MMQYEHQHSLADLLANVADEWFRYYGETEEQLEEMRQVIDGVFSVRKESGLAKVDHVSGGMLQANAQIGPNDGVRFGVIR
ncbi:hypothetical protein [Sphingomonas xinjiangensis]|uniref:Uncharacterized protein n=1 Tax=Sphingomonas xinjiangensis TaxID=643568 RepID=A0A840YMI3_9SPHN|nr:hypothetical protein [Sphingomonas xinjiangensis]MBB5710830.1 hypothetical protein [Sphingomonas xinjiangensis]